MLRRLSTYTAPISPRAHAVAGRGAEAHAGLVVLVTFFDGAVLDTAAFQLLLISMRTSISWQLFRRFR